MKVSIHKEDWQLKQPFKITGHVWTTVPCIVVELSENGFSGSSEAQGVFYLNETEHSMFTQVQAVIPEIEGGIDHQKLQTLLPAGGARNALDCALWDLRCKQNQQSIWQQTGITEGDVQTVFTIGLEDTPQAMADKAKLADTPLLKVKLNADQPIERLHAIQNARPDATLVVDANQGWDIALLEQVIKAFENSSLAMIEQPLPRGADADLVGFNSPITLAADESCLHCDEFEQIADRYQMINIKLDKTGGLTEALKLVQLAKANGMQLMVGNMTGTSLAMAPAFVIAQLCDFVDIDGPLLNLYDRPNGLKYNQGTVSGLKQSFWG